MKCYTLVSIIRLDTGASGMYRISAPGCWTPWKHSSISTASLCPSSYFHFIVCLSYSAKFHSRPAQFLIAQLTFLFVWCKSWQWRNMWGPGLSFRTVFQLLNVSFVSKPKAKGKHSIECDLSLQLKHGYDWLQASELKKFKLETYFILNDTTIQYIPPSPESTTYALKGCSIGYLWVTGLRNSV